MRDYKMDDNNEEVCLKKPRLESKKQSHVTSNEDQPESAPSTSTHKEVNVEDWEMEELKQFQVLDQVDQNAESDADYASESADSEEIPDEEIENMLDENLPEELKRPAKPKPKPYDVREVLVLEEKGTKHFDVLPQDWIAVRHNSGMPVYLNRVSRVCTFAKPYFLGTGSARRHDVPVSSVPCLNYRRAVEEEEKQKRMADSIAKSLQTHKINVSIPTVLTDEILKAHETLDENVCNTDSAVEKAVNNSKTDKEITSVESESLSKGESNPAHCPFKLEGNSAEVEASTAIANEVNSSGGLGTNIDQVDETRAKKDGWNRPVLLPDGKLLAATKIETVEDNRTEHHLTCEQMYEYCKNLFTINRVEVKKFSHWAARRNYTKARKMLQRPLPPEGTKLITLSQAKTGDKQRTVQRELAMNTQGRSYVCIFHDYVSIALKKQPSYTFEQLENAATPYKATAAIGDLQYGTGYGTSKRQAKAEAAKNSLKILLPEMKDSNEGEDTDFAFFDLVSIEDSRVASFCASMMEPSPHTILKTCLLRNFGTDDSQIQYESKKLRNQRMEYTMRVGKHSATVICRNKKVGKQKASQSILQALHPHVKSWGSLLRLYGSRSIKSCKEKRQEEQKITLLQDKAKINQPNFAILDKLRSEMLKLRARDEMVAPIGSVTLDVPEISSSDLNHVEL